MEATAAERDSQIAELLTDTIIHIVGKRSVHTELLVDFIGRELAVDCRFSANGGLAAAVNRFPDKTHLAFLDCNGEAKAVIFKLPELKHPLQQIQCDLVLYNVNPAAGIEMEALKRGIRGILYAHEPIEFFSRAARAVLTGELWYCRKVLSQFIHQKENRPALTKEACVVLTRREREIIKKIAEGCGNQAIARQFNISPHTVKTHAYNIYKKIKVSNRLQASIWLENSQ